MTRWSSLLAFAFLVISAVSSGCSEAPAGVPHTHNPDAEITLCGLCGEVKDSEKCCKDGATNCSNCGLHKGSPLCCSPAISGMRDRVLCRKCGEIVFSKKCCKPGPAMCPKCGLHKGSPGCCRIDKFTGESTGNEVEHAHEGNH